jgi:hypothetical protein
MKKSASGTHKSMGRKGGTTAGLESGVAEVQSYKAEQGVEVNDGMSATQRTKAAHDGKIAMK